MNTALRPTTHISSRILKSDVFLGLYSQIMATVEDTARFLDGAGREISRAMDADTLHAYHALSREMTRHLMSIASVGLLLRDLKKGGSAIEEVRSGVAKVRLSESERLELPTACMMPLEMVRLVEETNRLRCKLARYVQILLQEPANDLANGVHQQFALIQSAFAA